MAKKSKKKEYYLQIRLDSVILDMKDAGLLRMPVQYARLVKMEGEKRIAVVCTQYDLPATYTVTPNSVARWEGYCSEAHPQLYKTVQAGTPVDLAKIAHLFKIKYSVDNTIDSRRALTPKQLEKLEERNKADRLKFWKKAQNKANTLPE